MVNTYLVDEIPVHSLIRIETRDQALAFPTGRLALGVCGECGFMANTEFDPSRLTYSSAYEDTQGFSQRFNTFLVGLVRRLVDRYDVRHKRVLEIGCGKGEFLCLLCELGDNEGIGIDPACVPERIPDHGKGRVRIIPEMYREDHSSIEADVICCRHTLEHISETNEFLALVRKATGGRKDVIVFFEVPDTRRILKEGAFWDIYYEHCSYFTPGSLARLFRASGFDIEELYLDYDNQYIMLVARAADRASQPAFEIEDDLTDIISAVPAFCNKVQEKMLSWRRFLDSCNSRGKRCVIWGSGSKGVAFLTTLKITNQIEYVVDVNPYRQGKYMPVTAQQIIAPERLADLKPPCVVAMNPIYLGEIRQELNGLALRPHLLAV
ncbi:MAG: class I SAM-dependent methyltransferase [Planctomycetota bacterium]|jgi:SAM-dependent methyltransferase